MKKFFVVLVRRPEGWTPTKWDDNPPSCVVFKTLHEGLSFLGANEYAQGFNAAEMDNPMGFWLLVTDRQLKQGQKITVESHPLNVVRPLEVQ